MNSLEFIEKEIKDNDFEKGDKNCTCSNCPINDTCIYAWSSYNTNNKCCVKNKKCEQKYADEIHQQQEEFLRKEEPYLYE